MRLTAIFLSILVLSFSILYADQAPLVLEKITPSEGNSPPGKPVDFFTVYSDADGTQDMKYLGMLILPVSAESKQKGYFLGYYDQNTGKIFLADDLGRWQEGRVAKEDTILENSAVRLDLGKTKVSVAEKSISINWNIIFKAAFSGEKLVYLFGIDNSGGLTKPAVKGKWTVETSLTPAVVDSATKLLLSFEGSAVIDSSFGNKVVTAFGNTQLETNQPRVGKGAVFFDGDGDYLEVKDSADWSFGSKDFSIDFWVKFKQVGNTILLSQYQNEANCWRLAFYNAL
jgi:hypothetical protein